MEEATTAPKLVGTRHDFAHVLRAFDPNAKEIQQTTIGSICPWLDKAWFPLAQFTLGYLKGRASAKSAGARRSRGNGLSFSPTADPSQCCHGLPGQARRDGYAGLIKLRESGISFGARPHILFMVVRGYVPPEEGFEYHHTCSNGAEGCVGDLAETEEPRHVVPVPKEVNAQAKSKKCWGLAAERCMGHVDKRGRTWPPCPSGHSATTADPQPPNSAKRKRLAEKLERVCTKLQLLNAKKRRIEHELSSQ